MPVKDKVKTKKGSGAKTKKPKSFVLKTFVRENKSTMISEKQLRELGIDPSNGSFDDVVLVRAVDGNYFINY